MIIIDKKTRQRIISDPHAGDIVYSRTGDPTIANEDVPLGMAREPNVNGTQITREKQLWAGHKNELFGTDPGILGVDKDVLTSRGNRRDTTITQQVKIRRDLNA